MEAQAYLLDSEHEVVMNPPVYSGYLTILTNFKKGHVQFHPWIWGHLRGDFGHHKSIQMFDGYAMFFLSFTDEIAS